MEKVLVFRIFWHVDDLKGNKYIIDPNNPKSTDNIDTSNNLFDSSSASHMNLSSDSEDDNLRGVSNVVYRKEYSTILFLNLGLFKIFIHLHQNNLEWERLVLFVLLLIGNSRWCNNV